MNLLLLHFFKSVTSSGKQTKLKANLILLKFLIIHINIVINVEPGTIAKEFFIAGEQKYLLLPVSIGEPEQNMNLIIDLSMDRTWIDEQVFNKELSTRYVSYNKSETRGKENLYFKGVLSQDTFSITNKNILILFKLLF